MGTSLNQSERDELAVRYLKIPISAETSCAVDGVDANLYWQPWRGGGALIIGADGQMLFAGPDVSTKEHLASYKAGERTWKQGLEDLSSII